MSLDDTDVLTPNKGVGVCIANPTAASNHDNLMAANFVHDPTAPSHGAGAGQNFDGDKQAARTFRQTAGVCEARPGIIESTHIDPLSETSNKDDGWANATSIDTSTQAAKSMAATAANVATGAARLAYGHAMGDETAKRAGKEAVFGSK